MSKRDWLKHLGFTTAAAIAVSKIKPMTQSIAPTIREIDEVIARFMGYLSRPRFRSWYFIMPVVEKIESLENKRFGVCIDVCTVIITDYKENEKEIIQTDIYPDNGDTKLSITHAAVFQFITWYNQQTATNESKP